MVSGANEMAALALAADLPETITTLHDLYQFLKTAGHVLSGTNSAGWRGRDAAMKLIDGFKQTAALIPNNSYADVKEEGFADIYLSASGIASLLGAHTISVLVMSSEGNETQLAIWDSGADDSWIAKSNYTIVRSKYGTIWQEDFGQNGVDWPPQNSEYDKEREDAVENGFKNIMGRINGQWH
ncbi:hypothetical protein B0I37DRAFT_167614 [Chaetomium sp. MPI-CAGE-AT-0009]|nr:hypothetical protein B0I37DRAFT_167614 [Chaetomium sp. MPI-CAGE-AT-0009]